MLEHMIETDEFSDQEKIAILEDQLATLFVGNSRVREIRFQQELVNLLQNNPEYIKGIIAFESSARWIIYTATDSTGI